MCLKVNYVNWKKEYKQILESFYDKNIYLLFSGGKDSSVTMDLIARAKEEFGFDFTAHAATLPVHRYTDSEIKRLESYWIGRNVRIIWHNIDENDDDLTSSENPCLPCQELRKHLLNKILARSVEDWGSLVLIVSYSLWDIVSYSLEHLLSYTLANPEKRISIEKNTRFKETAHRFHPLLTMKEGYQVFRPLLKYNNDDILKVVAQKNIPILSIPCDFKNFRPKRILEKYYKKMGLRFDYHQLMRFAKNSLDFPDESSFTAVGKENYLTHIF